jgi:tetratricopeptide (TPR) repeat protein
MGCTEEIAMKISVLTLAAILIAAPAVGVANELDDSFAALQAAEAKKDAALVKKLAVATSELARGEAEMDEPADASLKQTWKERTAWARDVDTRCEYALYAVSLQAEPAVAIDMLTTLETLNPKSRYLDEGGYSHYFAILGKTGDSAKVMPIAEKALKSLPNSADLLLVLLDNALAKSQSGQALTYGQRLVNAMSKAAKPEGVAQADWDSKRAQALGRGYWAVGMVNASSGRYFEVDKALRAALPYIRGNNAMAGPALFQLGLANFQLGVQTNNKKRVLEAASFSEQASKMSFAQAQDAYRNTQAMRAQAAKMQ